MAAIFGATVRICFRVTILQQPRRRTQTAAGDLLLAGLRAPRVQAFRRELIGSWPVLMIR
jgi:hypothetical protein